MLGSEKIVATSDPARAKVFYRDTLRLRLVSEDQFAVVFNAGGTMLRVSIVPKVAAAPYTVLGWEVSTIVEAARKMEKAGIKFERFERLDQDELGIWNAPSGAKVAWFKDPDGNLLSITQFA